jgi:hypothetical protein
MTDPPPPPLLPLDGGPNAVHPRAALDELVTMPAWATLRTWKEPFRAIAIRGAARRLAAGFEPDSALWGGLLDATQYHCDLTVQLPHHGTQRLADGC